MVEGILTDQNPPIFVNHTGDSRWGRSIVLLILGVLFLAHLSRGSDPSGSGSSTETQGAKDEEVVKKTGKSDSLASTHASSEGDREKASQRPQWYKDANTAVEGGDFATVMRILWPLAARGNAKAQSFLGWLYSEGWGVPQDYNQAFVWFRRAADQGDYLGETWLELMYKNGTGVPQDYVRAYLWANLAAQNKEPADQPGHYTNAQISAMAKDFIETKMSPAQLAEARKLASTWKPEPVTEPLPKPEDIPNVRSYQAWLVALPAEVWIAEGSPKTAIVWKDEKSMKIGYQMINAGPAKTDLYELFHYIACTVYPGTRVMVGTPGALSSYFTVMDPPVKCQGIVGNSRLTDTSPADLSGEAELLTKAPQNFSKLVTGANLFYSDTADKNASGLLHEGTSKNRRLSQFVRI
jgi:uncharacterized protein